MGTPAFLLYPTKEKKAASPTASVLTCPLGSSRQVPDLRNSLSMRQAVVSVQLCPQVFKDTCQVPMGEKSQGFSILRHSLQRALLGTFKSSFTYSGGERSVWAPSSEPGDPAGVCRIGDRGAYYLLFSLQGLQPKCRESRKIPFAPNENV